MNNELKFLEEKSVRNKPSKNMEVLGKIALITGGSSGIGFAIAKELLENNIKGVALVDLNPPKEELKSNRVLYVKADVTDIKQLEEAFEKTVEEFDNLDIVFNNAGILEDLDWKKLYNVNLIGATNCLVLAMNNFLPRYKSGDEEIVVNTSSIAGINSFYGYPHYSASKFGVTGLVLAYGHDYYFKKTGVKVMAMCPGVTQTPLFDDIEKKVAVMTCKEEVYKEFPIQTSRDVARNVVEIIKEGIENGSIWSIVGGKKNKIDFPDFSVI